MAKGIIRAIWPYPVFALGAPFLGKVKKARWNEMSFPRLLWSWWVSLKKHLPLSYIPGTWQGHTSGPPRGQRGPCDWSLLVSCEQKLYKSLPNWSIQMLLRDPSVLFSPSITATSKFKLVVAPTSWIPEWGKMKWSPQWTYDGHLEWIRNKLVFKILHFHGCLLPQRDPAYSYWYSHQAELWKNPGPLTPG